MNNYLVLAARRIVQCRAQGDRRIGQGGHDNRLGACVPIIKLDF